MESRKLLDIIKTAERLKDTTRHCYTAGGRHESVAEHCWMAALMAYLLKDEFPEADMDKVIKMCLIHDLGEAFTGDIPSFLKTKADEETEDRLLEQWVASLPSALSREMTELYQEMAARQTLEARIFKAIDGLEAVIQHNASDIDTWSPNEYELNLTYAQDKVAFSPYLTAFRQVIREETLRKIETAQSDPGAE